MKRELFKQMLSDIIATEQGEKPLDLRAGKAPFTYKDYDVFDINDLDGVYDFVEGSEDWFVDIYANTLVGKFPHADYTGTALTSLSFEDALKKRTPKTAEDKFNARLKELGLLDEWESVGCIGRVGTENNEGIFIMVHEDSKDKYSEFKFPSMSEMSESDDFRMRALAEFHDHPDNDFIRKLVDWVVCPSRKECPLFPLDVYFLWDDAQVTDFEDDENASVAEYIFAKETEETCEYCDEVVILSQELKVQKCPKCGKWIVPCSACPLTDCVSKCPLERMADILNK